MLLHVKWPWIQRELEPPPLEEHSIGDRLRHEVADRDDRDLRRDRRQGERLLPVPEELLQERQEKARRDPEGPRSERDGLEGRIIGDRNGDSDLFDRRILLRRRQNRA